MTDNLLSVVLFMLVAQLIVLICVLFAALDIRETLFRANKHLDSIAMAVRRIDSARESDRRLPPPESPPSSNPTRLPLD